MWLLTKVTMQKTIRLFFRMNDKLIVHLLIKNLINR